MSSSLAALLVDGQQAAGDVQVALTYLLLLSPPLITRDFWSLFPGAESGSVCWWRFEAFGFPKRKTWCPAAGQNAAQEGSLALREGCHLSSLLHQLCPTTWAPSSWAPCRDSQNSPVWLSKTQPLNNPSRFSGQSQFTLSQSVWKYTSTSPDAIGQAEEFRTAASSSPSGSWPKCFNFQAFWQA